MNEFLQSLITHDSDVTTNAQALAWVSERNKSIAVDIHKTTLAATGWFYDNQAGQIVNEKRSFFQISGLMTTKTQQPVLLQTEIGYLGFLCKKIGGVLHFLVQAKIEPGNINYIQLSPTIQATRSNFTQLHGGAKPAYLDFFLNAEKHTIIVDQIQSEQSSRFLGKRNRNIVVMLSEDTEVEELPSHRWLTLGQLKRLMRVENLVNMDTRTVLSCLPLYKYDFSGISGFADEALVRSVSKDGAQPDILPKIFRYINNFKMFSGSAPKLVPLYLLEGWNTVREGGAEEFRSISQYPFKVVFCDIEIEGREVRHWGQPLFEAIGTASFGLFTRVNNGVREFLVRATPEIGCFDSIELGPTVQLEGIEKPESEIDKLFFERYIAKQGVLYDVVLSEEGGRFYHEQNNNRIIEVEPNLIENPPPGYWWCTYRTLNKLSQINNTLNIQLRNLLSLLEF
jgi:oxidase EvaA